MTTRNLRRLFASSLAAALLALAGCATPGPFHLYTSDSAHPAAIVDSGGLEPVDVPTFLAPGETLTGLAYDPFTDHLFLRLAPGNLIRVVDRPARAVKRIYPVGTLPNTGGGDLAVRPRDGRIFFTDPAGPALILTDRFGNSLGRITLATLTSPPLGVAYDSLTNRLLVLTSAKTLTTHRLDGTWISGVRLDRPVSPHSLAFDSETQELYAPLAPPVAIGVFNLSGRLLRTVPTPATFLDLGPRSLLRLF
jgi:DNA-binding beta-propeller fold protein YncE